MGIGGWKQVPPWILDPIQFIKDVIPDEFHSLAVVAQVEKGYGRIPIRQALFAKQSSEVAGPESGYSILLNFMPGFEIRSGIFRYQKIPVSVMEPAQQKSHGMTCIMLGLPQNLGGRLI